VIYRMFDKNTARAAGLVITPGNDWGIFMALFAAIWLAYTGVGIRRAHRAEPRLADDPTVHLASEPPARAQRRPVAVAPARSERERPPADEGAREHRGVTREDAEQLSFELPRENGER
jgi:hypothetical protein